MIAYDNFTFEIDNTFSCFSQIEHNDSDCTFPLSLSHSYLQDRLNKLTELSYLSQITTVHPKELTSRPGNTPYLIPWKAVK